MPALNDITSLSSAIKTQYYDRLLWRAVEAWVYPLFGDEGTPIGPRQGGTREYRKYNGLTATTTPLTDGIDPAHVQFTMSSTTVTPDQYGTVGSYTKKLVLTSIDDLIEEFSDILGEHCGSSINLVTRAMLHSGLTSVVLPGTLTNVNQVTSGDVLDWPLISKAKATLQRQDPRRFPDGKFKLITHTDVVESDLLQDEVVRDMFSAKTAAGSDDPYETGYVNTLNGIDIYATTKGLTTASAGFGGITVYDSLLLAQQCYAIVGIGDNNVRFKGLSANSVQDPNTGQVVRPVEIYHVSADTISHSNPLGMRGLLSWYAIHGGLVLNVNWGLRIRHACSMAS